MIRRALRRFAVWLYHRFTEPNPTGIGNPGSSGAVVGELREAMRRSLPLGADFEVRLMEVQGGSPGRVVVTLEVPR